METKADLAVIISDSIGRPWRKGIVDMAIGISGLEGLKDYVGQKDDYGQELKVTVVAIADELASAAELMTGKLERVPVALIKGYHYAKGEGGPSVDHGAGTRPVPVIHEHIWPVERYVMEMSKEAIEAFLREKRVGVLGINRRDGSPQLVPIWYIYDGTAIWISSEKGQPKVRNIARDPRVTLCVDDKNFPYKQVVVYGTATLTEEGIQERRPSIARHYLGEAEGDAYIAQSGSGERVLIKLVPERFYSWNESLD